MILFLERFWSKVQIGGPDDCWPWTKAKNKQGYGQVTINGKQQPAHRVAWEIENQQEMPAHLMALHSCDWKSCCNPRHVRPGTGKDNAADVIERGTRYTPWTHCGRGHEMTPENTLTTAKRRYCKACQQINARKTYLRKKAAA